jgi:hypothetical protein
MQPKVRRRFPNGRLSGGGHGQDAILELEARGIDYEIVHTYENGVRVGNIPDHPSKPKRTGRGQSWFPEDWSETDIREAGNTILTSPNSRTVPLLDPNGTTIGTMTSGTHRGVFIRVILDTQGGGSIFPDSGIQP